MKLKAVYGQESAMTSDVKNDLLEKILRLHTKTFNKSIENINYDNIQRYRHVRTTNQSFVAAFRKCNTNTCSYFDF